MKNSLLKLVSRWIGVEQGQDQFGNCYFEHRRQMQGRYKKRWAIYKNNIQATAIPPQFHAWLHYTSHQFPLHDSSTYQHDWQKQHIENPTGSPDAYRPTGHDYKGGQRAAATGDYQAWQP